MPLYIIVPGARKTALEATKYGPAAKDQREENIDIKARELWVLRAIPLKDGRFAIPADVVDHPAYAIVAAQLKGFAVEELADDALDIPVDAGPL